VYAAKNISAGELICFYAGELLTEDEFVAREAERGWSAHAIAIQCQELLERLAPPDTAAASAPASAVRRDRRRADRPQRPHLVIDAAAIGGIARDINDPRAAHPERAAPAYRGRQANCEYQEALDLQSRTPLVFLAASRDIARGEEVCVDYNDAFWSRHAILEAPVLLARVDAAEAEAAALRRQLAAAEAEAGALKRQLAALTQHGIGGIGGGVGGGV